MDDPPPLLRLHTESSSSSSDHPSIPCALCANDPTSLPTPPSLDKCTKGRLREHLIQFHSTLVATAFLHPNPSNNIHMWLMTCADYDTAQLEETQDGNESIQLVLTALLATGAETDQTSEVKEEEGDTRGKKRKAEDENEEIGMKMIKEDEEEVEEKEPEPFDLDALLAKYRLMHGMANVEEEEKVKKEEVVKDDKTCHMCLEESRYPGRHIAQKHLHKPLYECPICFEFGSYENCTIVKHMSKVHPEAQAQPVSNLEKYKEEILTLQMKCFPNRPMKLVKTTENPRRRERHICRVCKSQVAQSDRQRHVYHKHLCKERLFECPLCSFHSNYDIHRVKWHMKWIHKDDASGTEAISHEKEHREKIDNLNEDCFPGWQHRKKGMGNEEEKGEEEEGENTMDNEESMEGEMGEAREGEEINQWTCRLCMKEFKPSSNFFRHVAKEDLTIFLYECGLCDKAKAQGAYEIRTHLSKCLQTINSSKTKKKEIPVDSPPSIEIREEDEESPRPESRDTKEDEKVSCTQCGMEMKSEDRQMHVYRHHLRESRLYECPISDCDFSHHASSSDVRNHIKYSHKESHVEPRSNLLELSDKIAEWNIRCFPGWINRRLPSTTVQDFNACRLCGEEVRQTSRHIAESHLFIPLHECPLCDYGAPESRLVRRHIRNSHPGNKGAEPVANIVARRSEFSSLHDECFPGRPKRLSTIVISDEGRRTKCRVCGGVFARKRRMSHVLEKHINKKIFKCSLCPFSSTHDEQTVAIHVKDVHDGDAATLNHIRSFKSSITSMAMQCFPDWTELPEELK